MIQSASFSLYERLDQKWKEVWAKNLDRILAVRQLTPNSQPTVELLVDQLNRNCWAEKRLGVVLKKYLQQIREPDLRQVVMRHMVDEGRHYRLQYMRLKEMGVRNENYEPHPRFAEIFEVAESFDTIAEMYASHPINGERIGGISQLRMADHFMRQGDYKTALMFYNYVLPDETQHTEYAPRYVMARYANTPDMVARVEKVFEEGLKRSMNLYPTEFKE